MSEIVERLQRGRAAWPDLAPAFDHAIALARQSDHQAAWASNEVQMACPPAYPPLVRLLAEAVDAPVEEVPF